MPPLIQPELARPPRDWVSEVLAFANTDTPSEIWGEGATVWTDRDLDKIIEKDRQWRMSRLSWQSPQLVQDFFHEEIARSKRNEKPRAAILKPGSNFYRHIPAALEREDAAASQARLRNVLRLLASSDEITHELEAALKEPLHELRLSGSAAQPDMEITCLDQWWALPLASLCDELIGRLRVCAFRRCNGGKNRNYFVDWRGRRGGIPKMYCSDKHARAETAQNIRDRRREEREKLDREVREAAERRRIERERQEKEDQEAAARKAFRRLKDERAAAKYTGR